MKKDGFVLAGMFLVWLMLLAVVWLGGNSLLSWITSSIPNTFSGHLVLHRLIVIVFRLIQIWGSFMLAFSGLVLSGAGSMVFRRKSRRLY